jgi:hypothetical protein
MLHVYFCKLCVFIVMFNLIVIFMYFLLCMFHSKYSVSLCCSVYCLCVNVYCTTAIGARGGAVVEALRYKLEGHGIDSQWCRWNFSLT